MELLEPSTGKRGPTVAFLDRRTSRNAPPLWPKNMCTLIFLSVDPELCLPRSPLACINLRRWWSTGGRYTGGGGGGGGAETMLNSKRLSPTKEGKGACLFHALRCHFFGHWAHTHATGSGRDFFLQCGSGSLARVTRLLLAVIAPPLVLLNARYEPQTG